MANAAGASITVRLATLADAERLARLRYDFRSSAARTLEDEGDFVARCELWMQKRLEPGAAWTCWLAEREEALIGNVWVQLIEKIPNPSDEPERHAYLSNFYVRVEARGAGAGARLLSAALDWSRANEVHAVILWPSERSRPLYERHGFTSSGEVMELLISDLD